MREPQKLFSRLPFWAAALLLASAAHAQPAGEVEFSRGVGFAQTPGQVPRTLGKGLPLNEGDRLTTTEGGLALIKLRDGTRMTVRPNTELVLKQYQFKEQGSGNNSMLMQLVRGGFRAVTGLIAKSSPNAARVQTSTATIGIRGTDFDARICKSDCAAESARIAEAPRPNAVLASAKVAQSEGELSAVSPAGQRRRLVSGGSVYPGDVVETGKATHAVLAFRDDSRITLGPVTRFRVDNFVYDSSNAREGQFLVSILRGSVRALTGLIAKANRRNVGFSTATATIGIRGTGFDLNCTGPCAGEPGEANAGLTLWTWLGAIDATRPGQSEPLPIEAGHGVFITAAGATPLITEPASEGPRPDGVSVPPKLFSHEALSESEEGLFVFVRDGHIELLTPTQVLHLGRGEAGFAGAAGQTARPETIPRFLDYDTLPLPTSHNPSLMTMLGESGVQVGSVCK